MWLYSTRDPSERATFSEAVLRGAPRSGGLYQPSAFPALEGVDAWLDLPLVERSAALCRLWLGDALPGEALDEVVASTLTFPCPLVEVAPDRFVLELFHGPTLAFKDFGARFMARILGELVSRGLTDGPITILTATSGDTGAAVAHAFYRVPGVNVAVLYPKGRISPLQERLFCCLGENVRTFRVDGSFDDCQAMVKGAFTDPALVRRLGLTSANSINISRLVAQTFYYFEAAAQAPRGRPLTVSVPSGNFGDLTAGLFAQRMGLPVQRLLAASNANDVVPAFLAGGPYAPRASVATISNAMDVGAPSNWERIRALFQGDDDRLRAALTGGAVSDARTRETMRRLHQDHGYVADPHTAVAWAVMEDALRPGEVGISLSTAHPAKFVEVVEETLGISIPLPPELAAVADATLMSEDLPADLGALKARL